MCDITLGFASTGDEHLPGNLGLFDMAMALRWMHENIAAFGGDPRGLTIWGLSSGSAGVGLLSLSPYSRGRRTRSGAAHAPLMPRSDYLAGVMEMSGALTSPWAIKSETVRYTREFAERLGCASNDSAALVRCLKSTPAATTARELAKFVRARSRAASAYTTPHALCRRALCPAALCSRRYTTATSSRGPSSSCCARPRTFPCSAAFARPKRTSTVSSNHSLPRVLRSHPSRRAGIMHHLPLMNSLVVPTSKFDSYSRSDLIAYVDELVDYRSDAFGANTTRAKQLLADFYTRDEEALSGTRHFYLGRYVDVRARVVHGGTHARRRAACSSSPTTSSTWARCSWRGSAPSLDTNCSSTTAPTLTRTTSTRTCHCKVATPPPPLASSAERALA